MALGCGAWYHGVQPAAGLTQEGLATRHLHAKRAEFRMAKAWMRLEEAERQEVARGRHRALEATCLQEVCTFDTACRLVFPGMQVLRGCPHGFTRCTNFCVLA